MKFINKTKILSFLPQIFASLFLVGFVAYAWTGPGGPPPTVNTDAPINVGATAQIKSGPLQVNGFRNVGNTVLDGNVGIGTAAPGAKLDVNGTIKVGNFASPPTCDINAVGSLIYDTTKNRLFVCRTSGWKAIALGVDADGDGFLAGEDDCYDLNAQAFPGQTNWFTVNRGDGNFDYNCSGATERTYPNMVDRSMCSPPWNSEGWASVIPACGQSGTYIFGGWCSGSETRTQQCH